MCGIIGVVSDRPAAPILVDALKRMEYRGYDSAGIATVASGHLDRRRAEGKLSALVDLLAQDPLAGTTGIGHTRWATHGGPTMTNAHPHKTGPVAVVHNGIIENYRELKQELSDEGWSFESQTDTEIVSTLCASMLRRGLAQEDAAAATISRLRGAFALCFLFETAPDVLICARRGAPLVIGLGDRECYVGSDAIALAPLTNRVMYLEDGDWAVLRRGDARIHDADGNLVTREVHILSLETVIADKGPYRHFMLKEIHEQPEVAMRVLGGWIAPDRAHVDCAARVVDWSAVSRMTIVACGTACLAGEMAKVWMERIARMPVEVEVASEFRYREPPLPRGGVTLVVSQSGETADTLAALRYAKSCGQTTIALVNVTSSTIAREADIVLPLNAGPEIGVASTKAFTAQLLCMLALAAMAARRRGAIDDAEERRLVELLYSVPRLLMETLACESAFAEIAQDIARSTSAIFLGRGSLYPMAHEGALKLKEITYIHAEAYAAGELKHGPIALIDEAMPVVGLVTSGELLDKTVSNLSEVSARKGRVFAIGDAAACETLGELVHACTVIPSADPLVAPFAHAVAIQFLAYHTASVRGTDVDQPRNLAKSVTVE